MSTDTVQIHLFAAARAAVGESLLEVGPGPLTTILDGISERHPDFAGVRPRCSYLVDGVTAHGDPVIAAGSRVDVLPPFAGG